MSAHVVLRDVNKSFASSNRSREHVLRDVNLVVHKGEFIVLLGPSGCGKSTTLRVIAGLERPDSGTVELAGDDVTDVSAASRTIGMVFQNYALYPHLDVRENIIFGLKARRVDRQSIEERLQRAASMLELDNYLHRKPSQLSGGQRQRVALGRALVGDADVVLMDEPLSNLDAKLRSQMRIELRDLQRKLNLTVLYVTHDQVEAMTMADRVAVMNDGQIDQFADPKRLYQEPSTAFVAGFVGSPPMNLLARTDLKRIMARQAEEGTLEQFRSLFPNHDTADLVGIRPEHIELEPAQHSPGLIGDLSIVEYLGAETLVTVDVGVQLTARLTRQHRLSEGQRVAVLLDSDKLRIFPAPGTSPSPPDRPLEERSGSSP